MKYPHIQQHDEKDCGAACLSMISMWYGLNLPIAKYRELIKVDNMGASIYGIIEGAKKINFISEALEGTYEELMDSIQNHEIKFPFIARIINEYGYEHFIVVYSINDKKTVIGDPGRSGVTTLPIEIFKKQWQEQIITFEPSQQFVKRNETKGSFSKFFKYITTQKKMLAFVFVISILVTFINMCGSTIFQFVIYDAETTTNSEEIIEETEEEHNNEGKIIQLLEKIEEKMTIVFLNLKTVCISIILLYLFKMFLQILRGYLLSKTAKLVDVPLTTDFYNNLMELPAEFYGTRKTGEFMSRFYDTANIRNAVSSATLTLMLDTIMAIGCGVVLCFINVKLFFITIIIMVIYAVIMFLFKKPIKIINHEIMEQEAQVTSYLKETIDGIETIKSYQSETDSKLKLKTLYNNFADRVVHGSIISIIQEALIEASASIGIVVLLWIGAVLCIKNVINVADLMTFYYLIGYFLTPVQNLINLQPEIQTAIVAAERLNDVLDAEKENNEKPALDNLKGDISVKDVNFRYGNRDLVLDGLNILFKSGKKTAIVGESGCGKTTLAKLLLSFYQPEEGTITVNQCDIFKYSPLSIRKHIAYISQNSFLFSDSIYENIRMGDKSITDEQIEDICKKCFADDFICKLPMGYMTKLEENGNNLSEGQKQRISIARALVKNPDILIMDEATSNLDTITENSIKYMLDSISDNITTIIIAHRLNTIKDCDYIYVMDNGKILEHGTHEQLVNQHSKYYKFLQLNP